jgi:hypothetical protein
VASTPTIYRGYMGTYCYYSNSNTRSCAALPTSGYQRLCPCGPPQGGGLYPTSPSPPPHAPSPATNTHSPSPSTGGSPQWYVGSSGQTCTAVCSSHHGTCAESALRGQTTSSVYLKSVQIASPCNGLWTDDGLHGSGFKYGPAKCVAASGCGVDPVNLCSVPKSDSYVSCSGTPTTGYGRLCPCSR